MGIYLSGHRIALSDAKNIQNFLLFAPNLPNNVPVTPKQPNGKHFSAHCTFIVPLYLTSTFSSTLEMRNLTKRCKKKYSTFDSRERGIPCWYARRCYQRWTGSVDDRLPIYRCLLAVSCFPQLCFRQVFYMHYHQLWYVHIRTRR